jgi:hypothetical protein
MHLYNANALSEHAVLYISKEGSGLGIHIEQIHTCPDGVGMQIDVENCGGQGIVVNIDSTGNDSNAVEIFQFGRGCVIYSEINNSNNSKHAVYGRVKNGTGRAGYFDGELYVKSTADLDGDLNVSGDAEVTGGLNVMGTCYVKGNVNMDGDLDVKGTVSKGGGDMKIDHPLDPANKYLRHSFVESPDMMNIYNGNVYLDENGEAWVVLPAYFNALNTDIRYQLTCIGSFEPVYVAQEVKDNKFKIAGGNKGQKVSWQVTGIRQDAWAKSHRILVEEEKTAEERGRYLYPLEHGVSQEFGMQ